MCGIVGYVGKKQVVPVIIEGLRKAGLPEGEAEKGVTTP